MNRVAQNILMHYGTKRHSGRYPWGSGEDPYQHEANFMSRVQQLRKEGYTDKDIAKMVGLESTSDLRLEYGIAKDDVKAMNIQTAKSLQEKGYGNTQIAEEMSKRLGYEVNESTVRSWLTRETGARAAQARSTADLLKAELDKGGLLDVGEGAARDLNISQNTLDKAVRMLEHEGYEVYGRGVAQVTNPGKQTTLTLLCPPGTEYTDVYKPEVFATVRSVTDYISKDGGTTYQKSFQYPASMDSSRLAIRYAEDGGKEKDGVIELRRGVDDLSLGNDHYSQVRILVDDNKYLKGMAIYANDTSDWPDGVDVMFNTNKTKSTAKMDVLKTIKDDPDNPFGALIKEHGGQSTYTDSDGNEKLSLINKKSAEGDWDQWKDTLASQFLSKQSMKLINQQLDLSIKNKQAEYDEYLTLVNPTVKKEMLRSFAEDCDSAAVHLKAASLPRQSYRVILPLTTIKDTEVYAPNYDNGETVALVRYPHGGTFEIPILKVNNKLAEGKNVLGTDTADCVGISSAVAERLSGADFDGDTVMVIPCNSDTSSVKVVSTPPLTKYMGDFDPHTDYATTSKVDSNGKKHYYNDDGLECKILSKGATQTEMGKVTNLITDMTLIGSTDEEKARAVKYSMVVIDANKHELDYKKAYKDNDIAGLKKKYQLTIDEDGKAHTSAATLISRAKSQQSVPKRHGQPWVNAETGELEWERINPKTGKYETKISEGYTDKEGNYHKTTQKSTQMAETKDAMTLVSEAATSQELAYAQYANKLKALANQARKEVLSTGRTVKSASAAETYKTEVASLDAKLAVSESNAPRERMAQVMANNVVAAKKADNPDMDKKETKKAAQQALSTARAQVGAKRQKITLTDKEWEAIQAGAISESKLLRILKYADTDAIKERALPHGSTELSATQVNRIKSLAASGYTTAEIAQMLGRSTSTVWKYLNQ